MTTALNKHRLNIGDPDTPPRHTPGQFLRLFLHSVVRFLLLPPPSADISYNIMRSTVNMYKIVRGKLVRARVSADFQIFASTAGGNVLGEEGNCAGNMSERNVLHSNIVHMCKINSGHIGGA